MRATHGGEAVAVVKELRETRIDTTFIVSLMLDNFCQHQTICFANERHCGFGGSIIERIGDLTKSIERRVEPQMLLLQSACCCRLHGLSAKPPFGCQCPQSIQDDRDIDRFLGQCSGHRCQIAERSRDHGDA